MTEHRFSPIVAHSEWLAGPLRRYCQGVAEVTLRYELETHGPVP